MGSSLPPLSFLFACVSRSVEKNARWWDNQTLPNQHRASREIWRRAVRPGDCVIDATCGRGKDTLSLAAMTGRDGKVFAYDVQQEAIDMTVGIIENHLPAGERPQMKYIHASHEEFPDEDEIPRESVSCIVYNLGYLPGAYSDKTVLTSADTTIRSLENATHLVRPGGVITLTTYIKQVGGPEEHQAILEYTSSLDPKVWNVQLLQWINRNAAPALFAVERKDDSMSSEPC